MCIAIYKPNNAAPLQKEALERCFNRNPHGAGFALAIDNHLYIEKGHFDFEIFWKRFDKEQQNATALVHFRYASAGYINPANCHPWLIDKNHAMIHNGTFWDFINEKSQYSDTGLYTAMLLKPLFKRDSRLWTTKIGQYLLAKTLGESKMIILSNTGKVVIYNEHAGVWENNCWYSNDGFREESLYCGTCFPRQLYLNFPMEEEDEEIPDEVREELSALMADL